MLNNQLQMHLKLLQKEQFQNQQTGDLIGNEFVNSITKKSSQNASETVEIETGIVKTYSTNSQITILKLSFSNYSDA